MHTYFNLNFEFSKAEVHRRIAAQLAMGEPSYICVTDGVVLNTAYRKPDYREVVNGGMFSICDSSYVPLYVKWIYGVEYGQYCGSQIFVDIVREGKYRMMFLGTSPDILHPLRDNLVDLNGEVRGMTFHALPYRAVEDFDYPAIARMVNEDGAEIVWVALGAPKQEQFMARLRPHLKCGVMIAVGATFKFYSGVGERRTPEWMRRCHLEFLYRVFLDPRKQLRRCGWIVLTLPGMLWGEWRRKRQRK